MTSLKNNVKAVGVLCLLALPISGQAQSWVTDLTGNYEARNTDINIAPFVIEGGGALDPDTGEYTNKNQMYLSNTGNVGLGTTTPGGFFQARLHIADETPEILLDDGGQLWYLFADFEGMGFGDETSSTIPFFVETAAPFDSVYVKANGFVGVGTGTPTAKLHVDGVDDAKILVENTSGTQMDRQLFELVASGNPKFAVTSSVNATGSPVTWAFANPGKRFRLSRQGSGEVEFEILNNGNAILAGLLTQNSDVNAKRDIEAVDYQSVLTRVMELPISEWSYKDAPSSRHIGPMAQDFYHAFGLGDTDKGISSIDTGGVALAAIQGIKREKDAEILALKAELKTQNHEQQERILQLEMALQEVLLKLDADLKVSSIR